MRSKFSRWGLSALTMVSVATVVLLVTGWGSAAADNVASVIVANTTSKPVPVQEVNTDANRNIKVHEQGTANTREQNTDASGDIKVHEQGTANVNLTNSSLTVSQQPITGGGSEADCSTSVLQACHFGGTATASVLMVSMTSGVAECILFMGNTTPAELLGPARGGQASLVLPLSRPISFDSIQAIGGQAGDTCMVNWIGNSP